MSQELDGTLAPRSPSTPRAPRPLASFPHGCPSSALLSSSNTRYVRPPPTRQHAPPRDLRCSLLQHSPRPASDAQEFPDNLAQSATQSRGPMASLFSKFRKSPRLADDNEKAQLYENDATRPASRSANLVRRAGITSSRPQHVGSFAPNPAFIRALRLFL